MTRFRVQCSNGEFVYGPNGGIIARRTKEKFEYSFTTSYTTISEEFEIPAENWSLRTKPTGYRWTNLIPSSKATHIKGTFTANYQLDYGFYLPSNNVIHLSDDTTLYSNAVQPSLSMNSIWTYTVLDEGDINTPPRVLATPVQQTIPVDLSDLQITKGAFSSTGTQNIFSLRLPSFDSMALKTVNFNWSGNLMQDVTNGVITWSQSSYMGSIGIQIIY